MPDVKISQLPAGTANASAVVPATNAAGTTTQKITLGAIRDLAHSHAISDVTSLQTALDGKAAITNVVGTPSSLAADQNDYALPSATDIVRIAGTAARNVTGFVAGVSGQAMLIINVGTFAITLKHQSASSTAANRLIVPWAGDYVMDAAGGAALIVYDATDSRWRVV
jgi:hypothetical protein